MSIKTKGVKKHKEGMLALSAYEAYKTTRDIEKAYNLYMQENADALTSLKMFVGWASEHSWQERVNQFDAEEGLRITQETRRVGLSNALTAEEMCAELTKTCMEEFQLHKSEMKHSDIAKYLKIADDIAARWGRNDTPQVIVNVDGDHPDTVEIDAETLRRIGRGMAMEDDV